jgi:membrane protein required for beta-lactamase induction
MVCETCISKAKLIIHIEGYIACNVKKNTYSVKKINTKSTRIDGVDY